MSGLIDKVTFVHKSLQSLDTSGLGLSHYSSAGMLRSSAPRQSQFSAAVDAFECTLALRYTCVSSTLLRI